VLESLNIFVTTYQHVAVWEQVEIANVIRPPVSTTDYTDVDHNVTPPNKMFVSRKKAKCRWHKGLA